MRNMFFSFYNWVRAHLASISFIGGFVWDNLTLTRIDLLYDNAVFITYLSVAAVAILLLHAIDAGNVRLPYRDRVRTLLPLFVQFPLGGLFSGFIIFYTKSGSLFTSWPFLLILLFIFIGNEYFQKRYERFVFQMSIYFIALCSYLVFAVPIVVKSMGDLVFLLSGAIALLLIAGFVWLVGTVAPTMVRAKKRSVALSVVSIYGLFVMFYAFNLIPPIPLSLTDIGIYHSVLRLSKGDYLVSHEEQPWYVWWRSDDSSFHRSGSESVYCFSSVFAPTDFSTTIYHRWSFFNTEQGRWETIDRLRFAIVGGRDGGYRGFTAKSGVWPGSWRCQVETARGQVLGRRTFTISRTASPPMLVETVL